MYKLCNSRSLQDLKPLNPIHFKTSNILNPYFQVRDPQPEELKHYTPTNPKRHRHVLLILLMAFGNRVHFPLV